MFQKLFGDAFGRVAPENCRMTYNGNLAIKVAGGYRTWNPKTKRLTNVTNFTLPLGKDFVFVVPTTKVKEGDVILHNARPKAVVGVDPKREFIKVVNYENGLAEEIVPERHVFMGKTYFFGKLVSLFGKGMFSGSGCQGIMKMMMLKEFMGGSSAESGEGFGGMLPMMMLMGKGNDFLNFDALGDLELGDLSDGDDEDESEEDEDMPIPAKKQPAKKKK